MDRPFDTYDPANVTITGGTISDVLSLNNRFTTVANLLADTTLTYTAGSATSVVAGDYIEAQGFRYKVALSAATDSHITTAGGVKLYVQADADGSFSAVAFGVPADNTSDCSASISSAVAALAADTGAWTGGVNQATTLTFPEGTFNGSVPITLYTGVIIEGSGPATIFQTLSGFAGSSFFDLTAITGSQYTYGGVANCAFTDVSAASPFFIGTIVTVLSSIFHDILLNAPYGLKLDSYTQRCRIYNINSYGSLDQMLLLTGNHNQIFGFDKEGGTGSTTEPYLSLVNCNAITMDQVLIEGTGTVNKALLSISGGSSILISNFWDEASITNGHAFVISGGATDVRFEGRMSFTTNHGISISSSSNVFIDWVNAASEEHPLSTYVTIDQSSKLTIRELVTNRGYVKDSTLPGVNVLSTQSVISVAETGVFDRYVIEPGNNSNLLVNPSFSMGRDGWSVINTGTVATEEYVSSTFSPGRMGHVVNSVNGILQYYQDITIDADMVGVPVTVTASIKLVSVGGSALARLLVSGVGISATGATGRWGFDETSALWQTVSGTVIPQSAGALTVGFAVNDVAEVYFDECSARYGTLAGNSGSFIDTLQLAGVAMTSGSAAPTGGAHSVGDIVFNTTPTAGGYIGWVCTTAGTPGTWKTFGTIAT